MLSTPWLAADDGDDIDYNYCLAKIFHLSNNPDNHLLLLPDDKLRKRRYLGRYFAHPMMQNRRAKRDDYKSSAVRVTQRYVP
ncbi:hypothetical protein PsalMR5_03513 [Piscirickettsia salmonis]|uniref:hypothetical protein n=1 Tax=Piscirickettsia salmonis TaxID=1238 RepID=UPI0012BAEAF3|nr:hypothetical protein [Piscirickettsia salmonis]QGP56037.1 hypothetical protein PsalSR1_03507 [Piscirickettsia salmonis]QGP58098.1 hypothetical protein PsalBI1_00652 [Piscirickettsia salmonis]QGP65607.1 hypothetical protein PsalMR5_03513 [Piscirickettsia salmonis]